MELISDRTLKETEDRILILEQKAALLERQSSPSWTGLLLGVSTLFMGATLTFLILQITL